MAAPEPKATEAKPWQPSVLDRMLLLCQREADRIEIWQRTDQDGREIPEDKWDPGQRAERKLFLDLAQLCHLVRLVEPEFKAMVKKALGRSRVAAAAAAAKAKEPRPDADPSGDPAAAETPAD